MIKVKQSNSSLDPMDHGSNINQLYEKLNPRKSSLANQSGELNKLAKERNRKTLTLDTQLIPTSPSHSQLHSDSISNASTATESKSASRFSGITSPALKISKYSRFSLSIPNTFSTNVNSRMSTDIVSSIKQDRMMRRSTMKTRESKNMDICLSMSVAREVKYKRLLREDRPLYEILELVDPNANPVENTKFEEIVLFFSDCVDNQPSKSAEQLAQIAVSKKYNTAFVYIPVHHSIPEMFEIVKKFSVFHHIPNMSNVISDSLQKKFDISKLPALVVASNKKSKYTSFDGIDEVYSYISENLPQNKGYFTSGHNSFEEVRNNDDSQRSIFWSKIRKWI
ncbi:hypothetical protein BB560_007279 [Smittium megazygosporum]|uniref:Thioredoxin-like fold domain-containing protein n=1 Tax=Smittium megazygosporum TaxID=133381 RepID=A0A2T9XXB8_9FUNG|nr:hypothetical protein BB560_007279 [Smittium megazygosporum]